VTSGAILGLDNMLSTPSEKADAFARSGALAIDMESHHVARAAAERGLPFVAVRAISDQAREVLPAIMATFVDAEGQTKMSAVFAALIFGRVKIGELLQAGRASKRAHQALLRCRGALAGLH
jgi:adenosylhomocysteine nucleosidase